ncbi:ABC transporter permease [Desemzia sp. RIT804]|uniref:ABC transporter permease n=1 Tax=Desemzia sp. RIT 804 TaxID=2810209 RepID=UPI00194F915B|nr:ABC transporter permease [Desemzia sp. RIT 804]MBM6615522.1 ABC transporter permease [Desemzia sp. RIT 804]
MGLHLFKGTVKITKLLLRQNLFKIFLWLLGLVGITLIVANVYPTVYETPEDIMGFALTMENPAMNAMLGPNYTLEDYNIGAVFANEMLLFTAIGVGVMNILFVSSSTRDDEEEGRLEMVRALPVGRLAYLTASGIMVLVVNGALFLLTAAGLGFISASGMTWEASLLYGTLLGACGIFFAGLTVFFAQLAETARGTTSLSIGVLIVMYIIRAIGDVESERLALLSPLGWVVRTGVFVTNDWWPVSVLLFSATLLLLAALYLNTKRDINAGLLPDRKGKIHASSFLKTTPGLIWYLEKTTLISWAIVLFLLSAAFGAILGELEVYFSDMDIIQAYFSAESGVSLTEQFIALLMSILSVFSAIPVVSTLLKLKKEEKQGNVENYYSRSIPRNRILSGYYFISLLAAIVMQIMIGLGLYLTANHVLINGLEWSIPLKSALVYIAAIWVVLGLATMIIGVFLKGSSLVWLYVVFSLVVIYVGDLIDFPEWVNNLSAFHHIPQIPIEEIDWAALGILSVLAVILTLIGFLGYNKRDIQSQ